MKRCISCEHLFGSTGWTCPKCGFAPAVNGGFPTFVAAAADVEPLEFHQAVFDKIMKVEAHNFYYRPRQLLISWALEKFFGGLENFYDFGVGTGSMLSQVRKKWPAAELFGSDLSSDSLAITTKRVPDAFLFRTDVERIPFRGIFDVVGAFDVIEHLDDDIAALKALRLTLKPGGGLAVTVPQHMSLWSRLDEMRGHKRRYVGNELARAVRAAGFDVLMDTSFMASLFLPQYLSRRFLSQDAGTELEAEYRLPAFVNGALKAILMVELATVRMGMRYPFGGMRMVVARNPQS